MSRTSTILSQPEQSSPAPASAESASRSAGAVFRARLGRWRFWIIIAVIVLVVLTVVMLARGTSADRRLLSPGNPAPNGAMAVAEILGRQGVTVHPSRNLEETVSLLDEADGGSTLLLHDPHRRLGDDQLKRLVRSGHRIVLVAPGTTTLSGITDALHPAGVIPTTRDDTDNGSDDASGATQVPEGPLRPQCTATDPTASGPIDRGGLAYRGPVTCYPGMPQADSGSYVRTADGLVTVLGNEAILRNDHLAQHSNAALVLRTLGHEPDLVWYQPSPADVPAVDNPVQPQELLPGWVSLTVAWLGVVAVLGIFWRGRRDGPLVVEPLPVNVRAVETAEGRARLYQDAGALEQATAALRSGTLSRLAAHFKLGRAPGVQAVVDAVAGTGVRDPVEVTRILRDHVPRTNADLVRWSQQLHDLEKEAMNP